MKEKTTMKKFLTYNYTDLSALKEYLEEMALKGWELVNIRSFAEFKKCVPHRIRYNVELVPTAEYETNIVSERSKEFIDMCEQSGWRFVSNITNLYVFATEDENIPDIMTDNTERVELIKKTSKKQHKSLLLSLCSILLCFASMLFMFLSDLGSEEGLDLLLHGLMVMVFMCVVAISYLNISVRVSFVKWRKKAEKALQDGASIEYYGIEIMKRRLLTMRIYFGILLATILGLSIFNALNGEFGFALFGVMITLVCIGVFFILLAINKMTLKKWQIVLLAIGTSFVIVLISSAFGYFVLGGLLT